MLHLNFIRKLAKQGDLDIYEAEIDKAKQLQTLVKVPNNELKTLFSSPHHFCLHSVVRSETSVSTQIRLVNNTSTLSTGIGTLFSVNCKFPSKSLQSMSQCIFDISSSHTNFLQILANVTDA